MYLQKVEINVVVMANYCACVLWSHVAGLCKENFVEVKALRMSDAGAEAVEDQKLSKKY